MNITLTDPRTADAAMALARKVTGSFPDRIREEQLVAARYAVRYSASQLERMERKFVALDPRPSATHDMLIEARRLARVSVQVDAHNAEIERLRVAGARTR